MNDRQITPLSSFKPKTRMPLQNKSDYGNVSEKHIIKKIRNIFDLVFMMYTSS